MGVGVPVALGDAAVDAVLSFLGPSFGGFFTFESEEALGADLATLVVADDGISAFSSEEFALPDCGGLPAFDSDGGALFG